MMQYFRPWSRVLDWTKQGTAFLKIMQIINIELPEAANDAVVDQLHCVPLLITLVVDLLGPTLIESTETESNLPENGN